MKVLIASGGTYGHYFPALSVAQKLSNEKANKIMIVLDKYRKRKIFPLDNVEFVFIDSMPIRRFLSLQFLYSVVRFVQGIIQSFIIVARYNPDVCIGFGSYASFGIVFAAYLNKIPVVIHEQNVLPGKANRFLSYIADKILLSFPESKDYFKKADNIEITGNPLRPDLRMIDSQEARRYFGFKKEDFVILVAGGSQGSSKINCLFFEALALLPQDVKSSLAVIHLAGKNEFLIWKERYKQTIFNARVFDFFEDMSLVYSACDFVIARSGAMTVCEIDFFALSAILIPYPFAGAHQVFNAKHLTDRNKAVVLKENDLSPGVLAESIADFFSKRDKLLSPEKAKSNTAVSSAGKIVDILERIYKENKT